MTPDVTPDSQQTTYTRTSDDYTPQAQTGGLIYPRVDAPVLAGVPVEKLSDLWDILSDARALVGMWAQKYQVVAAPQCRWTEDADGNWDTACGETWTMIDGLPTENHYRFCPGCGKGLLEIRYVEPIEPEETT